MGDDRESYYQKHGLKKSFSISQQHYVTFFSFSSHCAILSFPFLLGKFTYWSIIAALLGNNQFSLSFLCLCLCNCICQVRWITWTVPSGPSLPGSFIISTISSMILFSPSMVGDDLQWFLWGWWLWWWWWQYVAEVGCL